VPQRPPDFPLARRGAVSDALRRRGARTFAEAARLVRDLPYGRPRDPGDALAVLREGRGTCSPKHALLARAAREQGARGVRLVVGLYRMTGANTPGVGAVLLRHRLRSLPEAHAYLKVGRRRIDFTRRGRGSASPFAALLAEREATPAWVEGRKAAWHRRALRRWARERGLDPARVWEAREECIAALSSREPGGARRAVGAARRVR